MQLIARTKLSASVGCIATIKDLPSEKLKNQKKVASCSEYNVQEQQEWMDDCRHFFMNGFNF